MNHWVLVSAALRVLPFRAIRDALLRHVESCPSCGTRLAGREEARRILIRPEDIGPLSGIWPSVRAKIASGPPAALRPVSARAAEPLWRGAGRWAAAAAGVGLAAVLTVSAVRFFRSGLPADSLIGAAGRPSIEIRYAEAGGRPAEISVIRPAGSGMVLIWFERRS